MELSHIGVYRSGDTEFSLYCASGIYADDIRIVFKADGKKEIHYRSYETDNECCDVL